MEYATAVTSRTGKQFFLVPITVLVFAGLCFSQPAVKLSPKSGPPTSNVLVSGSGFGAYAAIDIYLGSTDVALALANSSGAFSNIEIQIPASALPGDDWVSAVQRSTDTGAQVAFLVETNWAEFGFTPENQRVNPYENVLSPSTVGSIDLLWSYPTGGSVQSSPAVADGVVYVGSNDNNVYALNVTTGATSWKPFTTGAPVQSSPAVADGTVYIGSNDGNVYALRASTGATAWTPFSAGAPVSSSPAVANGGIYVGTSSCITTCQYGNSLLALNATTGALDWEEFPTTGAVGSPSIANGDVYAPTAEGAIYDFYATTGLCVHPALFGLCFFPGLNSAPPIVDGAIYTTTGASSGAVADILEALNVASTSAYGGTPLWSFANPSGAALESLAVAGNWVYVGAADDNVYALYVEHNVAYQQWTFTTGSIVSAAPAVANGVVYVASQDGTIYALLADSGAELWSYPTGGPILSSPAVANGVVYVGSNDNNVYAFGLQGGAEAQKKRSQAPNLKTLRPDLNLNASQPAATQPGSGYDD
jgi:eukaryotic-like serine/threonine-protein kinase